VKPTVEEVNKRIFIFFNWWDKFEVFCFHHFFDLAPVFQRVDSAIQWINHYPLFNSIGFATIYPLDGNLSGG